MWLFLILQPWYVHNPLLSVGPLLAITTFHTPPHHQPSHPLAAIIQPLRLNPQHSPSPPQDSWSAYNSIPLLNLIRANMWEYDFIFGQSSQSLQKTSNENWSIVRIPPDYAVCAKKIFSKLFGNSFSFAAASQYSPLSLRQFLILPMHAGLSGSLWMKIKEFLIPPIQLNSANSCWSIHKISIPK